MYDVKTGTAREVNMELVTEIMAYQESDRLQKDIEELLEDGFLVGTYHYSTLDHKIVNRMLPGITVLLLDFREQKIMYSYEYFIERFEMACATFMGDSITGNSQVRLQAVINGALLFDSVEDTKVFEVVKHVNSQIMTKQETEFYRDSLFERFPEQKKNFDISKITSVFPMNDLNWYIKPKNREYMKNFITMYSLVNGMTNTEIFDHIDKVISDPQFIAEVEPELVKHRQDINDLCRKEFS